MGSMAHHILAYMDPSWDCYLGILDETVEFYGLLTKPFKGYPIDQAVVGGQQSMKRGIHRGIAGGMTFFTKKNQENTCFKIPTLLISKQKHNIMSLYIYIYYT